MNNTLAELERVLEDDGHAWAKLLKKLLLDINQAVHTANGVLPEAEIEVYKKQYRETLDQGEAEYPKPLHRELGKRGKQKRNFSRNLLERLRNFETDTLNYSNSEKLS